MKPRRPSGRETEEAMRPCEEDEGGGGSLAGGPGRFDRGAGSLEGGHAALTGGGRWGGGSLAGGPTLTTFVASWKDVVVCGRRGRWGGWSLAGGPALTTRSWPGGGRGARGCYFFFNWLCDILFLQNMLKIEENKV